MVAATLIAGFLFAVQALRGTDVDPAGGTAVDESGAVSVSFGSGAVEPGTRVAIATEQDGPPPPDMVGPLTAPFEIDTVRGHARTGRVSVHAALPPAVPVDAVVMLIDDGDGKWRPLDTTYDTATATATATWPHFSRGIVGWFDPLFDARDAGRAVGARTREWTAEQMVKAKDWTEDRLRDVAGKVGEGLLAAAGGTLDHVECTPSSADWTFAGTGSGPDLLTGCTKPFDTTNNAWDMHLGNRAPYPMLVSLPHEISGPGAGASFGSMDLEDAAASMLWSLTGHTIVPAGNAIDIRTHRAMGRSAQINGIVDVSTLAVRALALLAVYFSRGESEAVSVELKQVVESTAAKLAAERAAGRTSYTLAEIARDLGTDSPLSREIRAQNIAQAAGSIDKAFAWLSFISCLVGVAGDGFGKKSLDGAIDQLADKCYQPFTQRMITITAGEITGLADPRAQAKTNAALAKGAAVELLNIRKLVTASVAAPIDALSFGRVGLTHGGLSMNCQVDLCAGVNVHDFGLEAARHDPATRLVHILEVKCPDPQVRLDGDAARCQLVTAEDTNPGYVIVHVLDAKTGRAEYYIDVGTGPPCNIISEWARNAGAYCTV